jgi:hypothetical protein
MLHDIGAQERNMHCIYIYTFFFSSFACEVIERNNTGSVSMCVNRRVC